MPTDMSVMSRSTSAMRRLGRRYILWTLRMSEMSIIRGLSALDDGQLGKLGLRRKEIESLVTAALEVLGAAEPLRQPGAGRPAYLRSATVASLFNSNPHGSRQ